MNIRREKNKVRFSFTLSNNIASISGDFGVQHNRKKS